jgi:hypothetical protein
MKGEVLSFPFVYFRNRDFSKITGDSNKKNLSALMALADPPTRHLPSPSPVAKRFGGEK